MSLRSSRVLLIHAGALGDFVLTLRVVAALRQAGFAWLTLLGRGSARELAGLAKGVDEALDLDAGGYYALFSAEAALPVSTAARLQGFDLAVDLAAGEGSPFGRRLHEVGIRQVIHLDPRPQPGRSVHVTDQWLAELWRQGVHSEAGSPIIHLPAGETTDARNELTHLVASEACPVAILHPGSGGKAKCWPLSRFIDLANGLTVRGLRVAFLVGPVEQERLTPMELAALRSTAPILEDRSLRQAAALLAASDVVVGNDSGTSHLAAAVGSRVVAIFGPTDPVVWRPLGARVSVIRSTGAGEWPGVSEVLAVVSER